MGLFDTIFGRKKRLEHERQVRERMEKFAQAVREENERAQHESILQNKRREEVISEAKAMGNNGKVYYILDFYLNCSHWREQNAILEKTPLALPVKRVDVDAEDDVVRKYKVSCLPKLILVDIDGNEIHRWKGTTQSEEINNYLYENGYATRQSASGDIVIKKNVLLSDGVTYNGHLKVQDGKEIPHGYGGMKCQDHNEHGIFRNGVINGLGYLNYHEWMCVGYITDGELNGWGIRAKRGAVEFGVFKNNILKVDLTQLVEIYWDEILHKVNQANFKMVSLRHKRKEIFIGVPQFTCGFDGDIGFHFLENGEVFLGVSDIDTESKGKLTGYYMRFDTKFNITCGKYEDSKFIEAFDKNKLAGECHAWVEPRYLDFNIDMNYSPTSFLFNDKRVYRIIEVGQTPENIMVLANPCSITNNGCGCEWNNVRCRDTVWFVFPRENEYILEQIEYNQEAEHPWIPDFKDYKVVFLNDLSEDNETLMNGNHLVLYKHVSCWEPDTIYCFDLWNIVDLEEYGFINNDTLKDMLSWIPNAFEKKDALENEWRNKGWRYTYPTVRDYVESLASMAEDNDFYGWLFDDVRMHNAPDWTLSVEQRWAYEQFLEFFPSPHDE